MRDVAFKTTSLGMMANGVLEVFGGVLRNGGNPAGKLPIEGFMGGGALVAFGSAGSTPRARSLLNKAEVSTAGVEAGALVGGCW